MTVHTHSDQQRYTFDKAAFGGGLRITDIETRVIRAERSYANFDEFWSTLKGSPSVTASTAKMSREQADELKERVRKRLGAAREGTLTLQAWANAVKGRAAA